MEHSRGLRGIAVGLLRSCCIAATAGAVVALAGCASMGQEAYTRAYTARALGLAPGDVTIVSRSYDETGPGAADIALANYTIETSAGYTYVCDPAPKNDANTSAATPQQPVCKRKPQQTFPKGAR